MSEWKNLIGDENLNLNEKKIIFEKWAHCIKEILFGPNKSWFDFKNLIDLVFKKSRYRWNFQGIQLSFDSNDGKEQFELYLHLMDAAIIFFNFPLSFKTQSFILVAAIFEYYRYPIMMAEDLKILIHDPIWISQSLHDGYIERWLLNNYDVKLWIKFIKKRLILLTMNICLKLKTIVTDYSSFLKTIDDYIWWYYYHRLFNVFYQKPMIEELSIIPKDSKEYTFDRDIQGYKVLRDDIGEMIVAEITIPKNTSIIRTKDKSLRCQKCIIDKMFNKKATLQECALSPILNFEYFVGETYEESRFSKDVNDDNSFGIYFFETMDDLFKSEYVYE